MAGRACQEAARAPLPVAREHVDLDVIVSMWRRKPGASHSPRLEGRADINLGAPPQAPDRGKARALHVRPDVRAASHGSRDVRLQNDASSEDWQERLARPDLE